MLISTRGSKNENQSRKDELKLDVRGFGCHNDCLVYYANSTIAYGYVYNAYISTLM
jgi:hypothetical protein